ncbi:MAG: DUF6311 domain-containing protein [Lachnospiraceae bacterium]|nr:DUF6311 domain-containing protein [Lachnospiraceae bacterium]
MSFFKELENKRYGAGMIFLVGFITGAILFVLTYGVRILDVTYDSWIFRVSDVDIHQHYIGWCHFREAPWTFPLGLMDSLSWPKKMSVLWTDSIPLLAIIFKAFKFILPETFQYFGIYGLFSFAMTGGTAALLIYKLSGSGTAALLSAPLVAESFIMLQRMFYHTSLTAHYLIIIPMLFYLYDGYKWSVVKKCCVWGIYFFIAVMIHPYLWAMGAVIAAFSFIEEILRIKTLVPALATAAVSGALTFAGLYITGAFYGNVEAAYSFGGYEANLNTFINSMGKGRFLPELPLKNPSQYEGFAYLGLGGLILVIAALIMFIRTFGQNKGKDRKMLIFILCPVFIILSVIPEITFNTRMLIKLPLPGAVMRILGIFRSNGRFIWPAVILIYAGAVMLICRSKKKVMPALCLVLCLIVQIMDMSPQIYAKYEKFTKPGKHWNQDLSNPALEAHMDRYDHIVVVPDNSRIVERSAFFAVKNDLTVNRFYFARDIDEETEKMLEYYHELCREGRAPDDVIFVFDEETYDQWKADTDLHFYDLTGTIIGIAEEIELPGL